MKMEMSTEHEFQTHKSLSETKQEIFDRVWEKFKTLFPHAFVHGTSEDIVLWAGDVEILSEAALEECVVQGRVFKATFSQARETAFIEKAHLG